MNLNSSPIIKSMSGAQLNQDHLGTGVRVSIGAHTHAGYVNITGHVLTMGTHHFKVKCDVIPEPEIFSSQQKVKVRLLDMNSTLPLDCRFLRADKEKKKVIILSIPEGDLIINRRAFTRTDISFPVKIVRNSGQVIMGKTIDLSGGGALIELSAPLNQAELCKMVLFLEEDQEDELVFSVKVVRNIKNKSIYRIGARFVDISKKMQNKICKMVIVHQFEQRRAELREITGRSETR